MSRFKTHGGGEQWKNLKNRHGQENCFDLLAIVKPN